MLLDLFRVSNYTPHSRRGKARCTAWLEKGALPAQAMPPELSVQPVGSTNPADRRRVQWIPMGPRFGDNSFQRIICDFIVDLPGGTATDPYPHYSEQLYELTDDAAPNIVQHMPHPEVLAGLFPGGGQGIDVGFDVEGGRIQLGGANRSWAGSQEFERDFYAEIHGMDEHFGAINRKLKAYGRVVPPGGGAPPDANPSFGGHLLYDVPHDLPFVYFDAFFENARARPNNDVWRREPEYILQNPVIFFSQGEGLEPRFREEEFWYPTTGAPAHVLGRRTTQGVGEEMRTEYRYWDTRDYEAPENVFDRGRFQFGNGAWQKGVLLFTNNLRTQLEQDSVAAERLGPIEAVSMNAAARGTFGAGRKVYSPGTNSQMQANGGRLTAARRTSADIYDEYMNGTRTLVVPYNNNQNPKSLPVSRRGDFLQQPLQGNAHGISTSGTHAGFGLVKCLELVNGMSNDFRGLRISMSLNLRRPIWHILEDGEVIDYLEGWCVDKTRFPQLSSLYFPFQLSTFHNNRAGWEPAWPPNLGALSFGVGKKVEPWMSPASWFNSSAGWDRQNNRVGWNLSRPETLGHSHHESQYLAAYTLLTGDTFCRLYACKQIAGKFLSIYSRSDDERNFIFQQANNDLYVGWGQTRMESRGIRALLNYYGVLNDKRIRRAIDQRMRDHYPPRWPPRHYPGKPHQVWKFEETRLDVAGFQDTTGGNVRDVGVNAFQSSALMLPAMWCALLWLEEHTNPLPDPYWDPDGDTEDAHTAGVEFIEEWLLPFVVSALRDQIAFDSTTQTYRQPHKICYQAGESPATRGDAVPNESRNDDLDHAMIGPLGRRYRHWYSGGGSSYAGWPGLVVIAWLLGNRGNTALHREARQLAFDLKGFRGTEESHTAGRGRGWGFLSGDDVLHRTGAFEDPFADWQLQRTHSYRGQMQASVEGVARPRVVRSVSATGLVSAGMTASSPGIHGIVRVSATGLVSGGLIVVEPRTRSVAQVSATGLASAGVTATQPRVAGPTRVSATGLVSAGVTATRPRLSAPVQVSATGEVSASLEVLRPRINQPTEVSATGLVTGSVGVTRPRTVGPTQVSATGLVTGSVGTTRPRVVGPTRVAATGIVSAAMSAQPRVLQQIQVRATGLLSVALSAYYRVHDPDPTPKPTTQRNSRDYTGDSWRPDPALPAERVRRGTVTLPSSRTGRITLTT